jgi:hypothetical protein
MKDGRRKPMTYSDELALVALLVSLLGIPVAAWLSHVFAVREFRSERVETKVDLLCQARRQLDHDLGTYQRLMMTFGGTELAPALAGKKLLSDPECLFGKIYDVGIYDDIVSDVARLRELGFDILLEKCCPTAHDALVNFRRKQETLTPAEKGQFIGTCFLKNDIKTKLASISRDEMRSFVESRR